MTKNTGTKTIKLLGKSKRNFLRLLFSRFIVIAILIILQICFIIIPFIWLDEYRFWLIILERVLSVATIIYLVNSEMDALSRLTWLIIIMVAPLFGSLLLIYTKLDWGYRKLKSRVNTLSNQSAKYFAKNSQDFGASNKHEKSAHHLINYFRNTKENFPAYKNTDCVYFPSGETFFEDLKAELRKAKKYIFMEYFIISEGEMWGEILSILEEKVKQGVEVRVMYDGMVELSSLSFDYTERLKKIGISAKAFSPISPVISTYYNYRDHRKITVIDGKVGFTGGANLADEYINVEPRFGHWKDAAVKIEGEAVDSLLILFLQMWSITEKNLVIKPYVQKHASNNRTKGYVIPYGGAPTNTNRIAQDIYIDILNHANDYVYITTPYLILNSELEHALKFAAERGVDVKIILPGIPDKKIPYALAKTYYKSLISSGVEIYQYSPGFVHAKIFVSDDRKAVVGTINLDYRSLYHHFECAVYMHNVSAIADVHEDFIQTLKKCKKITNNDIKNMPFKDKLIGALARMIAPLL